MRYRTIILTAWLLALTWRVSAAQEANRAGLVVRYDDTTVETYCVSFAEPEITGRMLLDRAGLALDVDELGMGGAICRIEEVGCRANDCFCECQGGACTYWSYWALRDGAWQYSAAGASVSQVRHGDVQGWSWGPGSVTEAIAPPDITFEEICAETGPVTADATVDLAPGPEATERAVDETAPTESPAAGAEEDDSIPSSYVFLGLVIVLLGVLTLGAYMRRKT